ncbi:MAG: DUF4395 domain-containing protein [Actinomycetota bacterium]|nr:DUF4395 domain-containing protein [Actinomycetota bacterium]MDQ3715195.1 DUF4395 domain-containing protein [Actinomycetota bacterium]
MPSPQIPNTAQVDVRGPRFSAWVTSVVLATGLLLSSGAILLFQTAVFAIGAFVGLAFSPYGIAFRTLLAPRLGPVLRREPQPPLRFAQLIGFGFAAVASVGYLAGAPILGAVAAGFALAAALLNATTGFCLGCEMYLLGQRALHRTTPHQPSTRTSAVRATQGV